MMHTKPQTSRVVQWVVPTTRDQRKNTQALDKRKRNSSSTKHGHDDDDEESPTIDKARPIIDYPTCRTICTFVEEHLKELHGHQSQIEKARSKLVNSETQRQQTSNINMTPLNDILRMKVRDEQTKAIETIKRLNDYLRELTFIEKQSGLTKTPTGSDIIDRLSDIRREIIQSLNDFVLSNSDIDVPIINSDRGIFDYDLCTDAPTAPSSHQRDGRFMSSSYLNPENSSDQTDSSKLSSLDRYDSLENDIVKQGQEYVINSDSQIKNLETRKREVEKLERETEELRRLFSNFYDLVKNQGEQVDTIEDNIVMATQRISEGQHNINKTIKGLTILMPVTGCMAGALIGGPVGLIIGGKLGGITIGCASSLFGLLSSYSIQRCITISKLKNE